MDPRTTLTLEELQTDCTLLERACISDGRATEESIAVQRPSAELTAAEGIRPWLLYYGALRKSHGGGSAAPSPIEGGLTPAQALRQMIHAEPIRVKLDLDRHGEEPKHPNGMNLAVHPKSEPTLLWLDSLDAQVTRTQAAAREALALDIPADDRVLMLAPLAHALAVRLWAWILTHPGPGLPFNPSGSAEEEPPEHFWLMSSADVVEIYTAHATIHRVRPRIVVAAYGGGEAGGPMLPLDGMLSAFIREGEGGRPASVLDAWSLGEIIGTSVSEGWIARTARARANDARGN